MTVKELLRIALDISSRVMPVFLAFLATLLVFNSIIMPRFVGHGREAEVPDLVGRTLPDAAQRLALLGLAVRDTVERASASVPPGRIMDQEPRAESRIKPERGVSLVVSRGFGEQRVPDLSGQTLRHARLNLSQDGYSLGNVLRVPSDRVARNSIVASDPGPGEVVGPDQSVSLLVSDGPRPRRWVMPNLSGREVQVTRDRLRFLGFPVVVESRGWPTLGPQRVRATEPAPGTTIAEGDTIWLFEGR